MSALVLDAGALLAYDRNDRDMAARLKVAQEDRFHLRTTGVVVAQVWRDSTGRQANLARLLKTVDVRAIGARLGRETGVLLGKAGTTDVVDATVVAISEPGDHIVTGDPRDIERLVAVTGRSITLVPC